MSVLDRLEALRDIQREGSVDYETLNLAISQITTLTQERDAARKEIEDVREALRIAMTTTSPHNYRAEMRLCRRLKQIFGIPDI